MKIFNYKEVDLKKAEEGSQNLYVRWLITKDMGAEHFAMRLFEMEIDGYSPKHKHPWEHEVFILQGTGVIYSQEQEKSFKSGDVIFIPANEEHQLRNTGKETVIFLCLIPFL
ncbi:MAG: cupin domain-containing protein [Nitrososphaeria archaeon]